MRVAIEATVLRFRPTGVGHYLRALVDALVAQGGAEYLLHVWGWRDPGAALARWDGAVARCATRLPIRLADLLHLRLGLPVDAWAAWPDVYHVPDAFGPPTLRARLVLTVHDLIPWVLPEIVPEASTAHPMRARYLHYAPPSLRRAAAIVAISESTRRDLLERFAVPPERVTVVPYGVDARFRLLPPAERAPVLARYGLGEQPYLLFVGRIELRKNVARLLDAFARLRRQGLPHRLVLVGSAGNAEPVAALYAKAEALGPAVALLDYVAHDDLPALYSGAAAFVWPSLYEGFGLPPLEALACGAPVVTSDVASLPEVVGDAALLVDPTSVEAIAAAVERLLGDATLRVTLRARGLERARRFTWAAAAQATQEVYRRVAG